ncbi:MAG: phosphonate ABC transporter ATP-binding protein [Candidatus Woesearchaeota archaeon]
MIKLENLCHTYRGRETEAIKNISFYIKKGESIAIIGSSGSGKSTLLKCINRLIEPNTGKIWIKDEDIVKCTARKAARIRSKVGMIFQNFNLIERETILQNVLNGRLSYNTPLNTLFKKFSKEDYRIVRKNIECVGLISHMDERVSNLSGGEKQRVAIARTLSQEPEIILADEPISNLDPKLMKEIMDLLKYLCTERKITLIMSLHFLDFVKRYSSRILGMREGRIVFDGNTEDLTERDIVEIYGKTQDWYLYGKTGF